MVPPLLLRELAFVPNQTRRVSWRSRLERLAVAQMMAAGLVRVLLDVLVAVAAAIVGRAASIQTGCGLCGHVLSRPIVSGCFPLFAPKTARGQDNRQA